MEHGLDPITGLSIEQALRNNIQTARVTDNTPDPYLQGVDTEGIDNIVPGMVSGDIQDIRAERQGTWSAISNSLGQLVTGTVGDIVGTPGYVSAAWKDKEDIDKGVMGMFYNMGEWIKEKGQDMFPIHMSRQSQAAIFDPMNSEFWANSIAQFGPTVAMMAVGLTTAGLASPALIRKLGSTGLISDDLVKAQRLISAGKGVEVAEDLRRTVQNVNAGMAAVASRTVEAGMESIEAYESTLKDLRAENPDADLEDLRGLAEEAATKTWRANSLLVGVDYLQFTALARGFDRLIGAENLGRLGSGAANLAFQAGGEAAEEAFQFIAANEAQNAVNPDGTTLQERLSEYLEDPELAKAAVQGALGGAVFQAIGKLPAAQRALNGALRKSETLRNLFNDTTLTEEEKDDVMIAEQVASGNAEAAKKHLDQVAQESQDPIEKAELEEKKAKIDEEVTRQEVVDQADIDPAVKDEYLANQRIVDISTKNINNLNTRLNSINAGLEEDALTYANNKIAKKLQNKYPEVAKKYSESVPEDYKAPKLSNTTGVTELESIVNKIVAQERKRYDADTNINTLKTKEGVDEVKKKAEAKATQILNQQTEEVLSLASSGELEKATELANNIKASTESKTIIDNVDKALSLGSDTFMSQRTPTQSQLGEGVTEDQQKEWDEKREAGLNKILADNPDLSNEFYSQLGKDSIDGVPMADIETAFRAAREVLNKQPKPVEQAPEAPTPKVEENKSEAKEPRQLDKTSNVLRMAAVKVRVLQNGQLEFIGLKEFGTTPEAEAPEELLANLDRSRLDSKWSHVSVKTPTGTTMTVTSPANRENNEKVDKLLYEGKITEATLRTNDAYVGKGFDIDGRIDLIATVDGVEYNVGMLPVKPKFQKIRQAAAKGETVTVELKPNDARFKFVENMSDISSFDGYMGVNMKMDFMVPFDKEKHAVKDQLPGHVYYYAKKVDGSTHPIKLHINSIAEMRPQFKDDLRKALLDAINLAEDTNKDTREDAYARIAYYVKPEGDGILRPIKEEGKIVGYGFWSGESNYNFTTTNLDPEAAADEILEKLNDQMVNVDPNLLNSKVADDFGFTEYRQIVSDRLRTNLSNDIVYDVSAEIVLKEETLPEMPNMMSADMFRKLKPAEETKARPKPIRLSNRGKKGKASLVKTDLSNLNRTEQIEWFKKNFPSIPISVLPSIQHMTTIEGAVGLFKDSAVFIADNAALGTTYHEAFHVVFNMSLTDKQRASILKEAKEKYGDLSDLELEEKLAEDFRAYKNLKDQNKPTTFLGKLSKKIKDLFTNLYNLVFHRNTITDLFHRIDTGSRVAPKFTRDVELASTYATYDRFGSPRLTEMAVQMSAQLVDKVLDTAYFESIDIQHSLEGLFGDLSETTSVEEEIWKRLFTPGENDLYNSLVRKLESFESDNPLILNTIEALKSDLVFQEMVMDQVNRIYNLKVVKSEESYDIDEGKNMLASYEFDKRRVDPKSDLSANTRAMFAKIPITYPVANAFEFEGEYYDNETGIQLFEDPVIAYNQFMEAASGALSFDDMIEKMANSNSPSIKWVVENFNKDEKELNELFIVAQRVFQISKMSSTRIGKGGMPIHEFINVNRNQIVNRLTNSVKDYLANTELKNVNVVDAYVASETKVDVLADIGMTFTPEEFDYLSKVDAGFLQNLNNVLKNIQEMQQPLVIDPTREDNKKQVALIKDIKAMYTSVRDYLPNRYTATYKNLNGDLVWSHVYPNLTTKIFSDVKQNYQKRKDYYSTDTMISELFKPTGILGNQEDVESKLLDYHLLAGRKTADGTTSDYSNLTDIDYFHTLLTGFFANSYGTNKRGKNTNIGYYNLPIPSDSSSMVMFSGYVFDTQAAINRIVKLAQAEQQRVKNYTNTESRRTQFRGDKFVMFEALNINADSTPSKVTEEVTAYVNREARKLYQKFNGTGLPLITSSQDFINFELYDKTYVVNNGKYTLDGKLIDSQQYAIAKNEKRRLDAMEKFVANNILHQASIQLLTTKDPANYKHQADYFKRAKGVISPATKLNVNRIGKDSYNVEYLQDEEGNILEVLEAEYGKDSVQYKNFKETLDHIEELHGKDSSAYRQYSEGQNTTDAQGYGDPIRYLDVMKGLVRETKELEDYIAKLESGQLIGYNDPHPSMAILKPFVQGEYKIDTGDVIPYQHKLSTWYLSPAMVGKMGNEKLKGLMRKMGYEFNENGYRYNPANRAIDEAIFLSGVKFGPMGLNTDEVYTYKNEDWGLQQETPEHYINNENKFGVQLAKLIMADLDLDGIYKVPKYVEASGQLTGRQLHKLYNKSLAENIRTQLEKINEKIGDKKEVVKLLREEIQKRGLGRDYLDAIKMIGDDTKLPLWFPTHATLIEQIVSSIYRNNVTTIKTPGPQLINATSWGFKNPPKVLWAEDGSIEAMEAYLPAYYRGQVDSGMDLLVYRIPTEDKYSMMRVRVKGFLPRTAGAAVVLPPEITSIAGLDFDIDKVFGYTFNTNEDGTKLTEGDQFKLNQNKVLDIILSVLSNKATVLSQTNPGGFEQFQDIVNNRLGLKDERKLDTISPYSQVITRSNIATGSKNIGISVNYNNLKALLQYSNVKLGKPIVVRNTELTELNVRVDTEGNLISRNMAEPVAQSVDNAKDPIAGKGNVNPVTLNVISTMLAVGVTMEDTLRFINRPEIRDFVDTYINGGATQSLKKELIQDRLGNFSAFEAKITDITKPTRALQNYLAIESMASSMSKLTQVVRASDNGIKRTFYDGLEKLQAKNELLTEEFHLWNLEGVEEFLNSDTYNKQLFESGISAPLKNLQTIFPQLSEGMRRIFDYYKDLQKNLTVEDMQLFFLEYMKFVASEYDFYNHLELERVERSVPAKIRELKLQSNDFTPFLNYFELRALPDDTEILQLSNTLGMDSYEQANFRRLWQHMLNSPNEEYRALAYDLLKYAFGQGGFNISFGNFAHLQPIDIFATLAQGDKSFKAHMQSRISQLESGDPGNMGRFIDQAVRVHHRKLRTVLTVKDPDGALAEQLKDKGTIALPLNKIPNTNTLDDAPKYLKLNTDTLLSLAFPGDGYAVYKQIPVSGTYSRGMKYYIYSPYTEMNKQSPSKIIKSQNPNEEPLNEIVETELPSEEEFGAQTAADLRSMFIPPKDGEVTTNEFGEDLVYNADLKEWQPFCKKNKSS